MIKHREIACSDDFEVLEIVSPGDFVTELVDPPVSSFAILDVTLQFDAVP